MAFKKLEPYADAEGKRKFADAGTVEGEKKPMFKCECGGYVVWVKSSKSGKNYLANCSRYDSGDSDYESYWYAAYAPHFKTCGPETEQATQRSQSSNQPTEPQANEEDATPW